MTRPNIVRFAAGTSAAARQAAIASVAPRLWAAPRYSMPGRVPRRKGGLGAVDINVDPTKPPPAWLQTITQLAQQGLTVLQAERLRKENLDRIRAGKPVLTADQMRALAATANVNVELPQDLKYAMIGGGAILLYLFAKKKR